MLNSVMEYDMNHHELQIYKKLYELIGVRVRLESDSVVYQGIIGAIIAELRSVNLRQASKIGGEYLGNTRLRFRDITALTVLESQQVYRYPKMNCSSDILKNNDSRKCDLKDVSCKLQFSNPSDNKMSPSVESEEIKCILRLPPHLVSVLPNDSIIIDTLGTNFTEAICRIFKERVIGVSFYAPVISRLGNLTLVCVSTHSKVYLFDIIRLRHEAFDNGLRDIFEDESIKKVIHDCRFPSDCLAHQYSTQLTNVFDTQVADFVISIQRHRGKYEYNFVTPLRFCLRNHLDIPPEFLYQHVVLHSAEKKCAYFTKRPISNEFRSDILNSVLYLILLYKTLLNKLLDPFHKIVDSYLRVLANANIEEINTVGDIISQPDSLPPSLLMYGIQTVRYQESKKQDVISLASKFKVLTTGQVTESESTCDGSIESVISHAEKEYEIVISTTVKPNIRQYDNSKAKLKNKLDALARASVSCMGKCFVPA